MSPIIFTVLTDLGMSILVWKQVDNPNCKFSEILHSDRNLETEKRDRTDFSEKLLFL